MEQAGASTGLNLSRICYPVVLSWAKLAICTNGRMHQSCRGPSLAGRMNFLLFRKVSDYSGRSNVLDVCSAQALS